MREPESTTLFSLAFSITLFYLNPVWTIEEPRQAIYLQPRNFNPHPYEINPSASRRTVPNTGPILFPPSPAPDEERSNFIRVDSNNRNSEHPVDRHPYPKVALKYRFRNPGRFEDYENQINPQISRALATHARKVLGRPISKYDLTNEEQKKYAFSYKVVDHLTGDDFSHTQSQNEKATSGEYRVKLPDGRVQIVSYTADKNGYKADVKYHDDIEKRRQKLLIQQPQDYTNQIESYRNTEYNGLPNARYVYEHRGDAGIEFGTRSTPVQFQHNDIEGYNYGPRRKHVVYAPLPTQPTQLIYQGTQGTYSSYNQAALSQHSSAPTHLYSDSRQGPLQHHPSADSHRFRIIPQDKVEIVNQGEAHVDSTVAPGYLENPGIILSSTVSPPSSFSGDYQHVFVTSIPDLYSRK